MVNIDGISTRKRAWLSGRIERL